MLVAKQLGSLAALLLQSFYSIDEFSGVVKQEFTLKTHAELFRAQMLTEMAAMSLDDGLVMQIHPGAFRNHNARVFETFGRDKGADIPSRTEYVRALKPLLDTQGSATLSEIVAFAGAGHGFVSFSSARARSAALASSEIVAGIAASRSRGSSMTRLWALVARGQGRGRGSTACCPSLLPLVGSGPRHDIACLASAF